MTIAGMILVNTPGSWEHVYAPLRHAEWHGWTPTDLVFPFFLFIVGVSMSFSYAKFDYRWRSDSVVKLLRRGALIFIVGLLLNAFPFYDLNLGTLRIMGVLQRIALAFVLGGLLVLAFRGKWLPLVLGTLFILLFYWLLMAWAGGEGAYALESNFARKIDLMLIGEAHMYRGFGLAFEPEGLISTIPSVGTVILGFLTGKWLKVGRASTRKLLQILFIGVLLSCVAWLWALVFPINKALWTSSYVLLSGGFAMMVLVLFYYLIDLKGFKGWSRFFEAFGVNPLFAFVLSVVWVKVLIRIIRFEGADGQMINGYHWLYQELFLPLAGEMNGSLLFAICHVLFFWRILFYLYRKRIFIKI
jgi:predicted acyltransferase